MAAVNEYKENMFRGTALFHKLQGYFTLLIRLNKFLWLLFFNTHDTTSLSTVIENVWLFDIRLFMVIFRDRNTHTLVSFR